MMFHPGKAANTGKERQMLGSAAAHTSGEGIADACEDDGLVLDLVAGAGETER
jgi:hypothetical protein